MFVQNLLNSIHSFTSLCFVLHACLCIFLEQILRQPNLMRVVQPSSSRCRYYVEVHYSTVKHVSFEHAYHPFVSRKSIKRSCWKKNNCFSETQRLLFCLSRSWFKSTIQAQLYSNVVSGPDERRRTCGCPSADAVCLCYQFAQASTPSSCGHSCWLQINYLYCTLTVFKDNRGFTFLPFVYVLCPAIFGFSTILSLFGMSALFI